VRDTKMQTDGENNNHGINYVLHVATRGKNMI